MPAQRHTDFKQLSILALVLACPACQQRSPALARASQGHQTPVRLVPVERGDVPLPIRAFGTIGAQHELSLAFKVGGVVSAVLVEEGVRVRAGQVLAVLDDTEMKAQLSKASQELDKAKRDFARLNSLHQEKSAALALVQDSETAVAVANANATALEFNQRHTSLLAPAAAIVVSRAINAGEVVAPGRAAFTLATTDNPVVRVALVDRDVLDVHLGGSARVVLDARPDRVFGAHISQIARVASPQTGTFDVELSIEGPGGGSLPFGLTAKVEIGRTEKNAVTVPLSALVEAKGEEAAVYVVDNAQAKRVPVMVRAFSDERAILSTSLAGVTHVIDTGASFIHDGAAVSIVP